MCSLHAAAACIRGSSLSAVDCHTSDEYWFTSETFLSPTQLQLGDARLGPVGIAQVKALKALPAQFDSSDLVEQQYEAMSEDGTKVRRDETRCMRRVVSLPC